jgi:methyltransferase (TIGR00027 family)
MGQVKARGASRTAVLVCQGRAVAHRRLAPDRFSDPTAMSLLRGEEREVVERVRAGRAPREWQERVTFELVQACGEVVVPRTIAIEEALRSRLAPQLVILGAGLDGRVWRMSELGQVAAFEVDHPSSQRDKVERLGDLAPLAGSLSFVPVDFSRDDLDSGLWSAGHLASVPTTWIWEGVVPYLRRDEVAATMKVIRGRSAVGSRLVVNYQAPGMAASLGRLAMRVVTTLARRPNPLAGEPHRSAWTLTSMARLLGSHGFTVIRDNDLLSLAQLLPLQIQQRRSLENGRVVVADLG